MTQQPDYSILEEGYYAPSPPDQTYNLRPKISLTPHGKISRACHSIAAARTTHVPQPELFQPETPKNGLRALEDSLGGPVTMQDLHSMVTDDPSTDLTPPSANQNFTPEIINHRYNTTDRMDLNNLLDSHGFSAPGDLALHLFTPDPKGAGTSQVFAPSSPREVQTFYSTHSFRPSELNTTPTNSSSSNSESKSAVMPSNSGEERERVGDAGAAAKDCWPSFTKTYPKWEGILNSHEELHNSQGLESTLAQRQKEFKRVADKFSVMMADNASRSGFEGFFVMVGNCVNEDGGLAQVSVTSGAENVLEDRLGVDKDSLAAQVKAHVYNKISLDFKDSLVFNRAANLECVQDSKQVGGSGGDDNEVEVTSNATGSMSYGEMTVEVRKSFHAAFVAGNAIISATQLPWFTLAKTTAEQSRQIINWPEGVPFAGESTQTGQKKAGIKALTTASLTRLYQAFGNPETAPRVVPADRAAVLEGKAPVFVGAAPLATSSATHGRRYFLPGRPDNLGLPRLTASKAKPTQSVKAEKTTALIPSADSLDPLATLTPMAKHKPKPSKGKGKAKKAPRRKIPKLTIANDEDDSDLFLEDSEVDDEEVAPVSSTWLRSHDNPAKKPTGDAKKKVQGGKGLSTLQGVSATTNKLVTTIVPPTPQVSFNLNLMNPANFPGTTPLLPAAVVPCSRSAVPRPPSTAPRPPSTAPRPPSTAPHPPSTAPRPLSATPHPPSTGPPLSAIPSPAAPRPPSATPHPPPTVTHPFLSSSLSMPAPFDTSTNSTSTKRAADLINGGQVPNIPSKRPRSAEGTVQTELQKGELTSTGRPSHEPSPPLAPSGIIQFKQEGYAPPLLLSHSHSGHYHDTSKPPVPDQYHSGSYPTYWGNYPSYSHQFKFPPPALLNQPAVYRDSHLPPSSGSHHHQPQGHQPPQNSQVQSSHTSHLQLPPISHLHPPPNPNPYYYNPTQPPPTYGFPPGANYGLPIGGAVFQAPYPASYNAPVEQIHHQEGTSHGSSNGPAPGPNV